MNNFIGEVMPSREEVVGWLREAGLAFKAVNCKPLQDQFNERAAQVEAMRCETCDWYGDNQQCNRHNGFLFQDDGCFRWEEKE